MFAYIYIYIYVTGGSRPGQARVNFWSIVVIAYGTQRLRRTCRLPMQVTWQL